MSSKKKERKEEIRVSKTEKKKKKMCARLFDIGAVETSVRIGWILLERKLRRRKE